VNRFSLFCLRTRRVLAATRRFVREDDGYSLTEVMIVVVILGILALLALPRFMNVTTRAKTTEAKSMLGHLHALQQSYRYEHDRFADGLEALGFEQNKLTTEGGTARYRIGINQASENGYVAAATAVVDFDGDGIFNVWEIDGEGVVRERTPD